MNASIVILQVIGGFTLGAIIGHILRFLGKILIIALGLALLPLVLLWYMGILYVNWGVLSEIVGKVVLGISGSIQNIEESLTSVGVFGLSTMVGFIFGLFSPRLHIALREEYKFIKRKNNERY